MEGESTVFAHPNGPLIVVMGVASLVLCQVLGPLAWYLGSSALYEIEHTPGRASNRALVQAGRWCGIAATGLLAAASGAGFLAAVGVI